MTTSIVTASDNKISNFDTGLLMRNDISYDEWLTFGRSLSHRYSKAQWQIGDWINIGESLFGEKYAQALDDLMFAYGTLRNYASICARIPLAMRNPKLKFHQAKHVAPLQPMEQARLIQMAAEFNLTGDEILEAVHKILGRDITPRQSAEGAVSRQYKQEDGFYLVVKLDYALEWETGRSVIIRPK